MPHCKAFHDMNCEFECLPEHRNAICGTASENDGLGKIRGFDYLRNKKLNKGLAFTLEERQLLCIHGLLPAVVKTEREQVEHCLLLLDRLKRKLDKNLYLHDLAERNQRLFFQLIASDIESFLPLLHAPILSEVCLRFSMTYQIPRGVFVTSKHKGHVYNVLGHWPERDVRVVVVTDGERILELGDQGANGMALPIADVVLYTALAGIRPQHCLPVILDCGTDCNHLILDPLYIGLRQKRLADETLYDEFIDEFMNAVVNRFGQNCLMHFEGLGHTNSFHLLAKYHDCFCMFNNDIQGTGAIVLAGILAALRVTKQPLEEQVILLHGASDASFGIALLFYHTLRRLCADTKVTKQQIWLYDSEELIAAEPTKTDDLVAAKSLFRNEPQPVETLLDAVRQVRPSILIGTKAKSRAFTKEILEAMGEINQRPIIFVLSSDIGKAECTAQEAYTSTSGRCLFASGCQFPLVYHKQKKYQTMQIDNFAVFPGVVLGVLCAGMFKIPMEVFYIAADVLADLVSSEDLALGRLYFPRSKLFCGSMEIAKWVMAYAYRFNFATVYPEPVNKIEFIKSQMYNLNYPSLIPVLYGEDDC